MLKRLMGSRGPGPPGMMVRGPSGSPPEAVVRPPDAFSGSAGAARAVGQCASGDAQGVEQTGQPAPAMMVAWRIRLT
ncbi:hypothetical protein GCM10017557_09780 [Streptomyces aurantiacus]|uniref:Uncharacterized protein n=1 Tax=Streptomyces aurantiacus TaxID=47760 RepID=A0A7G1NTB1_9ACTN|nr:hypothetical protein GCM10017557_09780 [Streptomyces aurantiacus]